MLSCVRWSPSTDATDAELRPLVRRPSICANNSGKTFVNAKFAIYGNMSTSLAEIPSISNRFKNAFMQQITTHVVSKCLWPCDALSYTSVSLIII